ncbi:hypothetical protein HJFPF1_04254 [Paramyrothecium foliicola]|nr:hypothetical protein HJFPF1_04254 [Paramyrothecium foliicola]
MVDNGMADFNASLAKDMRASLNGFTSSSSFAGYESLDNSRPLGLEIRGSQSALADTWELSPNQLVFHNTQWLEFLKSLRAMASSTMDFQGNVGISLDKLLIYGSRAEVEEDSKRWLFESKELRPFNGFFYLLNNHYSCNPASSANELDERSQVLAVHKVAEGLPVHVFLALLDKEESGPSQLLPNDDDPETSDSENDGYGVTYPISNVTGVAYSATSVVDANRNNLALMDLRLSRAEVFNEELFKSSYPDQESYSNEAIVMVPHDHLEALIRSGPIVIPEIPLVRFVCELQNVDRESMLSKERVLAFEIFCEQLWNGTNNSMADDIFTYIKMTLIEFASFSSYTSWQSSRNLLPSTVEGLFWSFGSGCACAYTAVDAHYSIMSMLRWARETISKAAIEEAYPNPQVDSLYSVEMIGCAMYFVYPYKRLSDWVLPLFGNEHVDSTFFLELYDQLLWDIERKYLKKKKAICFLNSLRRSIIESADFSKIQAPSEPSVERTELLPFEDGWIFAEDTDTVNDALETFVASNFESDSDSGLLQSHFEKLIAEAPKFSKWQFHKVWAPLFSHIVYTLCQDHLPVHRPLSLEFCITIIVQLLEKFVGPEPVDIKGPSRPQLKCNCLTCTPVNTFLSNSTERIQNFRLRRYVAIGANDEKNMDFDDMSESVASNAYENGVDRVVEQLNNPEFDCLYRLSHPGDSSQNSKLTVVKTCISYEEDYQTWKRQKQYAAVWLDSFFGEVMRILLGSQYETIVNMKHLEAGTDSPKLPRVEEMAASARREILLSDRHQQRSVVAQGSRRTNNRTIFI